MDNAKQPSPVIVCCLGRNPGDIDISQQMSRSTCKAKKKQRIDTGNYAREAVQTSDFNKLKSVRYIWSGSFKVNRESLGVKAYLSSKACQKVKQFSEYSLPQEVEVKKVPRSEVWPKRWKSSGPTEDCIGLLFFAPSLRSNEVSDELVKELIESDSAFQASIGIVDLLIFPSTQLPEDNHLYHGKHYLWGAFYKRRQNTYEEGVTIGGQDGSVRAIEEEQLQEQHVLDKQVEVQLQHESPGQEEGFTSPLEPNASSVADPSAEGGGREQPSSDSEPAAIKLVGLTSARTPRAHQQQTQEIPSEGSMVFSVPEEMVTADVIVGGQHGSVCAMEEEQLQEQHVLDQQDEVQLESPGEETSAVKLAGNQPMVENVLEVEEGFISPPEPNASSLAEHSAEEGGQGQSSSVSEPLAIELFGVTIAQTPRAQQQRIQETPGEGSMVFSVPKYRVTADSNTGNSFAVGAGTDQQHPHELPEAFGLNGDEPEPPQPDVVDPNAGLELSLVQQDQVGLAAPGVEASSMEVDLELRLAVTPSPVQQEQQVRMGLAAPGVEASNMEVDLELSLAVKPSCDLQLKMSG